MPTTKRFSWPNWLQMLMIIGMGVGALTAAVMGIVWLISWFG